MSTSPWLTLIASEIGGQVLARDADSAPVLARLAGRGTVRRRWPRNDIDAALRPWQRGLADALNLATSLPSAAVSGIADPSASWLHAEPVHFVAGLDRLTFLPLIDDARPTPAERTAVFDTLAAGLNGAAFELKSIADDWFIRSMQPLRIATSTPEAAASNELQSVMPRGVDAPAVRRLMTELQMMLHEHPVNEARARRGLPAINAIWLWGSGSLPQIEAPIAVPVAFGSDVFIAGLYRSFSRSVLPLPSDAMALMNAIQDRRRALAVVAETDVDSLESRWIAPLSRDLATGRLSRLDLILEEWHIDVRRNDLRKFWRRALPASQWESAA